MKKHNADIFRILELEYLGNEGGAGVATEHLKARIARRPGRWRQRMRRDPFFEGELPPYDEAA